MAAVGVLACAGPARRGAAHAACVQPTEALRQGEGGALGSNTCGGSPSDGRLDQEWNPEGGWVRG
jgi:hypothetical protein